MKRLMMAAAMALVATAGPAAAQTADPVDAAEYLLGAVCFPLFDGQAAGVCHITSGGPGRTRTRDLAVMSGQL